MSLIEKLDERSRFYQNSYSLASKESNENLKVLKETESILKTNVFNLADQYLGEDLSEEEKKLLDAHFGFNFIDIDKKFKKIALERQTSIEKMKDDPRYKEYLELDIADNLEMVIILENNETFNYLIQENFHNEEFVNEPYFEIFNIKYQPRFWKFKKFANKLAKEVKFKDYKEMFEIWFNLRMSFKSLIEDKRVEDVIKETEELEAKIKTFEEKLSQISLEYLADVKSRFAEILLTVDEKKFSIFNHQDEVNNLVSMKQDFSAAKKSQEALSARLNLIMDNLNKVEEMIAAAENNGFDENDANFSNFFANTDPTTPIHQLIPDMDWDGLKRAFADKGISLKNKENYTKVVTEISNEEKENLLNKYGVKEGEIFIDETLAKKRN
jgi:prefoldin subunit 5